MKKLITKSCEEIMTTLYKPIEFAVDELIAQGLYILAGSPKVGKSWLALQLCLAVAKGEKLLERETRGGTALYLCLEDGYERIQKRLYELTDEPSDKLFFSIMADSIGCGLEQEIEKFKSVNEDLRLVVIDTLQMVRSETESTYGNDYAELLPLKNLAQQLGISIVLVHHLRKAADSDPFNMVSGSTGLNGCVDGLLVLMKAKRSANQATLHCTGRDIEDKELLLTRQGASWELADESEDKPPDNFSFAIHDIMVELVSFKGSATELCGLLAEKYSREFFPNMIKKDLTLHGYELQSYGVKFTHKRSNGQRLIILEYDRDSDTGDGKNLMPEPSQNADPAVTAKQAESSQTVDTIDSASETNSNTCEKSADPVGQLAVPFRKGADPEYVLIGGKKVEMKRYTLNELLNQSAARLREKIFRERGMIVPEFDPAL
ncbi:MAG: AAA family ATPase [Ruminococcus sp.]|nr:AAA family ATPase [Ruminococcus sp.]